MPEPFLIAVPDAAIHDVRARLATMRWPGELEGVGWDYGTNESYLRELCEYWRHTFDWRAAEARLNAWPQVTRERVEETYNVVHRTDMPSGGHFPAVEEPARLVDDLRTCFRTLRTSD